MDLASEGTWYFLSSQLLPQIISVHLTLLLLAMRHFDCRKFSHKLSAHMCFLRSLCWEFYATHVPAAHPKYLLFLCFLSLFHIIDGVEIDNYLGLVLIFSYLSLCFNVLPSSKLPRHCLCALHAFDRDHQLHQSSLFIASLLFTCSAGRHWERYRQCWHEVGVIRIDENSQALAKLACDILH